MRPVFYARRRRWPVLAAMVVLAAIVGAVAVARTPDDGGSDPGAVKPMPAAEEDVPLMHVHGLGINPADGAMYVATHSGLLRLSGHGEPSRVGGFQDLMGFTVIGPDTFLSSGHPDIAGIREGLPGRLGVMQSTDAGGRWEILALRGEADLHAIAQRDGTFYGVDAGSGRFLAATDLQTWEARSSTMASAIAVDPDTAERVVAAGGNGVTISDDGGRTWRSLAGPPLLLLAWDATSGLWGATSDGRVYRRATITGTWAELDRLPGEPQALLADGGAMYAATAADNGATEIQVLTDGEWKRRYTAR